MSFPLKAFDEQWQTLKPVWRVLLAILVAQLIGAALGGVWNIAGHWYFNLWYGAAYATPMGLVSGLVWQAIAVPNGLWAHRGILFFLAALATCVTLAAYLTFGSWQIAVDR